MKDDISSVTNRNNKSSMKTKIYFENIWNCSIQFPLCEKELIEILSFITDNFPILFLSESIIFDFPTERQNDKQFSDFQCMAMWVYVAFSHFSPAHSIPFINGTVFLFSKKNRRLAMWINRLINRLDSKRKTQKKNSLT